MLSERDKLRLKGVHPTLLKALDSIFTAQAAAGTPMFVINGVRTVADQAALYAQGRTAPGKIVTECDGVRTHSNHQLHTDGYGHASDCAFAGTDPFASTHDWATFGRLAEAHGLTWGGHFPRPDLDHVELP